MGQPGHNGVPGQSLISHDHYNKARLDKREVKKPWHDCGKCNHPTCPDAGDNWESAYCNSFVKYSTLKEE